MADHFMLELSISRLQLHSALKYIEKRKTTIVPNGFGKWRLGNMVTKLGGNWKQYPYRADINKEDGLWQDYGGNSVTTG